MTHHALTHLPAEIQSQIVNYLKYPDALSMKLTSRHFYTLVSSSVSVVDRVTWLLERAQQDLPIPKDGTLKLHNDAVFLKNAEVQRILRARITHQECDERWAKIGFAGKWPGCLISPECGLCGRRADIFVRRTRLGDVLRSIGLMCFSDGTGRDVRGALRTGVSFGMLLVQILVAFLVVVVAWRVMGTGAEVLL